MTYVYLAEQTDIEGYDGAYAEACFASLQGAKGWIRHESKANRNPVRFTRINPNLWFTEDSVFGYNIKRLVLLP